MPEEPGYATTESGQGLEEVWGEGFMSPGGRAEVARIVLGADLSGLTVLDVGCGLCGPAMALLLDHDAAHVVGADVQADLLDLAAGRARAASLSDRLTLQLIEVGQPLPFADGSFDAVFSKDAIIHVADKGRLYAELCRVLRPGGLLLISDWLRGAGRDLDPQVEAFVTAAGHDFTMIDLGELAAIVEAAGFIDIQTQDRRDWYLVEARAERLRIPEVEREFWDVLVASLEAGALRPGHVRARTPLAG